MACHENQAMPYSKDLGDPDPRITGVALEQLWCHSAAQEFTMINTEMYNEFMLEYQKPVIELFGLSAYGCCEDLTEKLDSLKKIKNLRRIAVTPFADLRRCAEAIGDSYVISYRPSPAKIIANSFDEENVRHLLRNDFAILRANNCVFDITIKDVETIRGRPEEYMRLIHVIREEIDRLSW